MADPNNKLPEGTDAIIGGAGSGGSTGGTGRSGTAGSAATTSTQTNATGGQTRTTDSSDATDALITGGGISTGAGGTGSSALGSAGTTGGSTAGLGGTAGAGSTGGVDADSSGGSSGSSGKTSGVRGLVSNAGGKLRDESKNKIHSLASQGLQQGSSTLTNIAGIVDDTVQQIEERLGPQYGEYARKASQAINGYATTLQNKNPDELVDDARNLVRKSPTVALTGAAVLGFGLVRLLKVGLEEAQNGTGNRNNDRTSTAG